MKRRGVGLYLAMLGILVCGDVNKVVPVLLRALLHNHFNSTCGCGQHLDTTGKILAG